MTTPPTPLPASVPSLNAYVLGQELTTRRIMVRMPARSLAWRLGVPVRLVVDLEAGRAPLTADLVTTWCAALGVKAPDVLARVAEHAPPGVFGFPVNLRSLIEASSNEWFPHELAAWARETLSRSDSPEIFLPSAEVTRLAQQCGISKTYLAVMLRDFAPLARDHVHESHHGDDHEPGRR